MDRRRWQEDPARTPFGVDFAVGCVVMVAAVGVAARLTPGTVRLVVVAAVVTGYTVFADDVMAGTATAGLGWLLLTGFAVSQYGELTLGRRRLVAVGGGWSRLPGRWRSAWCCGGAGAGRPGPGGPRSWTCS